jgi:hypothetical protein
MSSRTSRLKAIIVTAAVVGVVSAAPASGDAGVNGNSGAHAGCVGFLSSLGFNASNFGGGQQVAILAPQKLSGEC